MLIAGVNLGKSRNGMPLKDGGACILHDGQVLAAIAEERVARNTHAGGYEQALAYCLNDLNLSHSQLDMLIVSNCADFPLEDGYHIGLDISPSKVRAMTSHHLSHASAAYYNSPFNKSVIVVFDNEGNILDKSAKASYYDTKVERNSYYLAEGSEIRPLLDADDALEDNEIGPGEVYRHFTYYLGWHSYVYAGKTMGLAPYGNRHNLGSLKLFDLRSGQIHSLLQNGRENPIDSVVALGERFGVPLDQPRSPGASNLTGHHKDVAAFVQHELEEAILYKLRYLHSITNVDNLCLSGGVALNCVANNRILEETPFKRIYVPPAPGDTGQCVGNALYAWWNWVPGGGLRRQRFSTGPYLGKEYEDSDYLDAISSAAKSLSFYRSASLFDETAELLSQGMVVAWFQGRSELGPRALGNRSILADARLSGMKNYLNHRVKLREDFRPFAPVVLADYFDKYFKANTESPFMEITSYIKEEYSDLIPSVVHVDGSSRVQTVRADQNPRLTQLLKAFDEITGTPILLNTSFNLGGSPMVESPRDAVECFTSSEIDVLVLGDFIIRKGRDGAGYYLT